MAFKALVFDMDGTIADLYGVEGWLPDLRAERTRPYEVARPMYNMFTLMELLLQLKNDGWTIIVTTWTAKDASAEYNNRVRRAKKEWLDRHNFPYDEFHGIKYGTTKANCTRKYGGYQILIDDNADVRNGWHLGPTFDAHNDIITFLTELYLGD